MQNLLENLPKIRIIPNFWRALPETPGIYSYFKNDRVVYIGKTINLKRRVSSYFDLDLEPKTAKMISEANFVSYIQVSSELEALLLEARLIRKYMPHYNIAAKDDKHPLYIVITKEEFPRVITVRKIDLNKGPSLAYYGPFPSSTNVKSVLKLIRRIFPFSDHKITSRGCLYSHIGLCSPCPSEVTRITNYELRIMNVKKYKRDIRNIKQILDGDIDKLTKGLEKDMIMASKAQDYESATIYRNQLSQIEYITRPQMPTDFYMENPNLYEDQRNLEIKSLEKLIKNSKLKIKSCTRIECYDIAHLAGTNPTASMVTFINGEADKKFYRHFKIKIARGGDDYESMKEVAKRRSNHFTDWGRPDLIIVDGGVGQVTAFKQGVTDISVVGIAKHPDRLIIADKKIKLQGATLQLVSRIRDEAHRFARRLHHKLVSRAITNPE